MLEDSFTIVFCSCDKYTDLWQDFFRLFKKYWPEFNGRIILNTESESFKYDGLDISEPLGCPPDTSWSDRLSLSLKKVKTPYVLIMLDDFYLRAPVDNARLMNVLRFMREHEEVVSSTFLPEPGLKKWRGVHDLKDFFYRKQFAVYKMTAHITLYKTDYLMSLLKKGESAWEFEVNGTIRSWFKRGKFIGVDKNCEPIFPYDWGSLVMRGSFNGPIKEYFEREEGCKFTSARPTVEKWEQTGSGGIKKKLRYLCKGSLSIFKDKAL